MRNPFYIGDFANTNELGSYINQNSVTQDPCKEKTIISYKYTIISYRYRLGA